MGLRVFIHPRRETKVELLKVFGRSVNATVCSALELTLESQMQRNSANGKIPADMRAQLLAVVT